MFIVAGLLDAVTMIGVGIALFFTFANPSAGVQLWRTNPEAIRVPPRTGNDVNINPTAHRADDRRSASGGLHDEVRMAADRKAMHDRQAYCRGLACR